MIKLAEGLEMDPSQAATQTLGAVASKGKGKSYLASKFFEQLHENKCPAIVVDPVGNWWNVKLDRDGVSPGLPVPVIGGLHGDVPLDPALGTTIATFLIESGGSAIIDTSELSGRKTAAFAGEFFEALFRAARLNQSPRMLILEEAQVFAPQNKDRGDERMIGAITKIVRLGRNYGIGSMMVTQRPQSVSKEVLNMIECLFVGGMQGPHERKAIEGWVTDQGVDLAPMVRELPALPPGEFFCWSPSWLKVAKRIKVLPKRTFDGSSTPTLTSGGKKVARELAPVDVAALRALLAGEDDGDQAPAGESNEAHLRTFNEMRDKLEAAEAERNAALDRASEAESGNATLRRKVSNLLGTLTAAVRDLTSAHNNLAELASHALAAFEEGETMAPEINPTILTAHGPAPITISTPEQARAAYGPGSAAEVLLRSAPRIVQRHAPHAQGVLQTIPVTRSPPAAPASSYRDALLAVIALHGPVDRVQLSILSGKSKGSSTFREALAELAAEGLITTDGGRFTATPKGKAKAPKTTLPKGRALFDFWCGQLDAYTRAIFECIARASHGITRQAIGERTGKSIGSSTFREALATITRLGLVERKGNAFQLTRNARESMGL